jgi:hypothetical protein
MATEEKVKLPRGQKIAVTCHGGYVLRARVRYQDKQGVQHETGWSGDVPVGQTWSLDMSGQSGITTGCKMWPYVDVKGATKDGGYVSGETVEYAPNGHTFTYEAKGTIWDFPLVRL